MPRENRAKAASLPLTQARKQADQQVPEGYKLMSGSGHTPFLHHIGPLFYKKDEQGKLVVAIQPANLEPQWLGLCPRWLPDESGRFHHVFCRYAKP